MAYISKINNFTNNTDYDISAMVVKITDTVPTTATTYYPNFTTGKTENSNYVLRANTGLVFNDNGTSSGEILISNRQAAYVSSKSSTTGIKVTLDSAASGNHGVYSWGYWDGETAHTASADRKWLVYRNTSGDVILNGNAATATKLATARSLKTKLDSTTAITFDGSADQNAIPVTGTLPVGNGGTGNTSFTSGRMIYASSATKLSGTPYMHFSYTAGTTSTAGREELVIGNTTASGTESNAYGILSLYSHGTKGTQLISATNSTAWYTATLPAKTGTIALTSDLSAYVLKAGDTMTGNLTISKSDSCLYLKNPNMDTSTTTNSASTYNQIFFTDKGGRLNGFLQGCVDPSASAYLHFGVRTRNSANSANLQQHFSIIMAKDGTASTYFTHPAAWRAGLSVPAMTTESYPALLPTNGANNWIKVGTANTTYGLLPSQAGGAGSGHNYIGTSSWYWKYAYIDEIHGTLKGNATGLIDGSSTMTSAYNKAGLAYGDYTWLAGWNGYELRAVNKSQFAQASHSHAYLPLAGGTMNDEKAITFQITRKKDGGGGWAYAPIRMIGNDSAAFATIGVYGSANTMTYMYIGANAYNGNNLYIYPDGHIWATKVYGAVWNDYAEYRITKDKIEPGRCVIETGKDDLVLSTERLQPGAEIVSDTFGFAIGETDEAKTPIATTGRVLAYIYEGREAALAAIGKPVCSGPDGTVSIMTDEEYQKYGYCAIGTISAVPDYEEWGTGNIKVNNRIWIRIR